MVSVSRVTETRQWLCPHHLPGMDPFLEEPRRWDGVRSRLIINSISDDLADRVSPDFFVGIEERVHNVTPDDEQ